MSTIVVRGRRNVHDIVPMGQHHLPIYKERGLVLGFLMEVIKETLRLNQGSLRFPLSPRLGKSSKKYLNRTQQLLPLSMALLPDPTPRRSYQAVRVFVASASLILREDHGKLSR